MNKKLILPLLLLIGCSKTPNIQNNLKEVNIENKLINNYQISKSSLTKLHNNYYFFTPTNNGINLFKLNQNYDLVQKKHINMLLDPKKMVSNNQNLYLLAYDQDKNRPVILVLDKNLNIKKVKYVGDKFDEPRDIVFDNNLTTLLLTYKKGADIKIASTKTYTFSLKDNQFPKFIKRYKGGFLIIGSNQSSKGEDLLIMYVKDKKIIWAKTYDFGMEDTPKKATLKNNKLIIDVTSQDYMGALQEYKIEVNPDNGKIFKKEKGLSLKPLPLKFRT
ncbi:MAG: hypothetical protein ABGX23_07180 [Nautiliaceae bacterium]